MRALKVLGRSLGGPRAYAPQEICKYGPQESTFPAFCAWISGARFELPAKCGPPAIWGVGVGRPNRLYGPALCMVPAPVCTALALCLFVLFVCYLFFIVESFQHSLNLSRTRVSSKPPSDLCNLADTLALCDARNPIFN